LERVRREEERMNQRRREERIRNRKMKRMRGLGGRWSGWRKG